MAEAGEAERGFLFFVSGKWQYCRWTTVDSDRNRTITACCVLSVPKFIVKVSLEPAVKSYFVVVFGSSIEYNVTKEAFA